MNKTFRKIIYIALSLMALTSCNDWLDVSPKSQIKEEEQFSREGGYKDQLTGVYTAMSSTSMYCHRAMMSMATATGDTPHSTTMPTAAWRVPSAVFGTAPTMPSPISTS